MKKHELLIVGGSAGGIQAAICAQKHHGLKDIVVIRPEVKAMVPCGIPYIYGTLGGVEKNILPDKLLGEAKLKVGEVISIDRKGKTVTLKNGEVLGYNKLILATGSNPLQPPIPGTDKKNVWFVKKYPDYLQELALAMDQARHIVVIGGGFIGVEFADECRKRGHEVTIVELLEHCLQLVCTEELCIRAEEALRERGVKVITSNAVKSIGGSDKVEFVKLESGEDIKCDMVIIGIGVLPNTKLAEEAGLKVGPTRGIEVDEFQRTTDGNIFAVGDCAEKYSFFNGQPVPVRLASVATREGKIAAANLYLPQWRNIGTVGIFSTVIGQTAIAMAGLTDAQAHKLGHDVVIGEAEAASKHPGTMPGAEPMRVRLIFDRRSGKMLGGCACCAMTAGEVGNVMAVAIVNGMTMEQVAMFPMGTHPWLTASPLSYQITDAASDALHKTKKVAV
ncbi:MAG: FAD-dependent oxidoreductase [Chloroflexi bacterium]|nr:FAD-dependent oxidoreductase [Chloroflexota bacterium]MBL7061333.1 FAD-dependent oxidoreductase [Dehalococcoidia bacterium]